MVNLTLLQFTAEKGKISVSQEQAGAELKFKLGLKDVLTADDVLGIFDKTDCSTDNIKKENVSTVVSYQFEKY